MFSEVQIGMSFRAANGARSAEAKRMQNISVLCSSSAKSTALQTTDFSLPLCSCIFVPGITARKGSTTVSGCALIMLEISVCWGGDNQD